MCRITCAISHVTVTHYKDTTASLYIISKYLFDLPASDATNTDTESVVHKNHKP